MESQRWRRLALAEGWQADVGRWLAPNLEGLGSKTRRRMCPAHIAGLIGPGDRKSTQPMAARSHATPFDRLHHFIGAGLWDSAPLEATLWRQVSWRKGTKGPLAAGFAAVRVRIADGAPQRIGSSGAQHMPGEEARLPGEHRSNGERKY